jgi:uncharacterized repeat protein (TIGR03803 family)
MQTPSSRTGSTHLTALVAAALLFGAMPASAAEKVLYSFTGGADGGGPNASLISDSSGNLFGTTHFGGITSCGGNVGGGCGVVFQLSPKGTKWTEAPLYAFADGADGGFPNSGVLMIAPGNLVGNASTGGSKVCSIGCGVVYQVAQISGVWSENVLHTFAGTDGEFPNAPLTGSAGMMYSTTVYGGTFGNGTVFRIFPAPEGWTETVLYNFTGKNDGSKPYGAVVQDASGNLYGTTYPSDSYNGGVAYELTPGSGGTWNEQVLHAFGGAGDGSNPYAGVIVGKHGLFGTTINGGPASGGIVYELSRTGPNMWKETILHGFGSGTDGSTPYGGLIADQAGNLFGTTLFGGTSNSGTVFEVMPRAGGAWKERVLYNFTGKGDGQYPGPGLVMDASGDLFGTTSNGGKHAAGVVFEIVR